MGLLGIAWCGLVLVALPSAGAHQRVAGKIVLGDEFRTDDLDRVSADLKISDIDLVPNAGALRTLAIVAVRRAEDAIRQGRRAEIDGSLDDLAAALDRALAASPTDPFLWLARFWLTNIRNGFDAAHLPLLAASYRYGPREGWIGVRRNPLALAVFERLDAPLREAVVSEFVGLLNSGFEGMPDVFVNAGPPARHAILSALGGASETARLRLSRSLYQRGFDISVPGIVRPDTRPWSR
ncbi:hypothetical protein CH341_13150 [Rhodoplanes roseus]|uniref:Uncharacterized protein n=2 Tax=Rhodoplanes roseus TaxID=29409 RepID=A0A327L2F3_9BRAD|nr:hypothetical protein CH341_13150 [Rhodoplanes roseus]